MEVIRVVEDTKVSEQALKFFKEIYNAGDNEIQDINKLFNSELTEFHENIKKENFEKIDKNLKMIIILIDNSEKKDDVLGLESLRAKEKSELVKISVIFNNKNTKNKEFVVPLNLTLFQFKKILANHFEI